jgi:succinate dehydrogenase cytochrome b subunit
MPAPGRPQEGRRRSVIGWPRLSDQRLAATDGSPMTPSPRPVAKPRPVYLDLPRIRQPIPAIASILHRISGALLFFVGVPALLWGVQASLASPEAYEAFRAFIARPFVKLIVLVLVWAYLHHLFAGLRHLLMDVHIGLDLEPARQSATIATVAALLLTLLVAIRVW